MKNKAIISTLVFGLTLSLGTHSYATPDPLNFNPLEAIISQKNRPNLSSQTVQALPSDVFARLDGVKAQKDVDRQATTSDQSEKLGLNKIVDYKLTLNYNR